VPDSRTRPSIFRRFSDDPGPNRILPNISGDRSNVLVGSEQVIVKASLPESVVRIDGPGSGGRPTLEASHETDKVFTFHQQMDMVGHEAPGKQPDV
jgi:hypothetical protein